MQPKTPKLEEKLPISATLKYCLMHHLRNKLSFLQRRFIPYSRKLLGILPAIEKFAASVITNHIPQSSDPPVQMVHPHQLLTKLGPQEGCLMSQSSLAHGMSGNQHKAPL
ncbi:uncharacterized protein J3R85_019641 [Psidium guajava]|nr:uncharacterized protein J3R85_019641 [Psidium guajava]